MLILVPSEVILIITESYLAIWYDRFISAHPTHGISQFYISLGLALDSSKGKRKWMFTAIKFRSNLKKYIFRLYVMNIRKYPSLIGGGEKYREKQNKVFT